MEVLCKVIYCNLFNSKDGKVYTKLFVPVGNDVVSVITSGDYSSLVGVDNVPFRLGVRDGQLALFFNRLEV